MRRRKTALVTGSTSGTGLAIASELAARGMNIVLNGVCSAASVRSLRKRIEHVHGVDVAYHAADLSREDQIDAMMNHASERFDGIDILVNYASIPPPALIDGLPGEKWHATLATNLKATLHTTRLALLHMKFNRWGRIVNVASTHAVRARPSRPASIVATGGIGAFTRKLSWELADLGITANAVIAGRAAMPLLHERIPDMAMMQGIAETLVTRDALSEAQPAAIRFATGDLAELVAYLCSDAAASISGTVMNLDEGWYVR